MFDGISPTTLNGERDRVFNSETRRALRHAARLLSMVVLDALTAVVILSVAAATAILSVPWQLSVAVTVGVALVLPVTVLYVMLRMYGLSHPDVVYVAKQAYRETVAETVALSGTSTVSAVFDEAKDEITTTTDTDTEVAESTESATEADEIDTDESSAAGTEEENPTDLGTTETEP